MQSYKIGSLLIKFGSIYETAINTGLIAKLYRRLSKSYPCQSWDEAVDLTA